MNIKPNVNFPLQHTVYRSKQGTHNEEECVSGMIIVYIKAESPTHYIRGQTLQCSGYSIRGSYFSGCCRLKPHAPSMLAMHELN